MSVGMLLEPRFRRGDVRRAKLYYLRGRRGKAARIAERSGGAANAADAEAPGETA